MVHATNLSNCRVIVNILPDYDYDDDKLIYLYKRHEDWNTKIREVDLWVLPQEILKIQIFLEHVEAWCIYIYRKFHTANIQ